MPRILCFDDEFHAAENRLFRINLSRKLASPAIHMAFEKTVKSLESEIRREKYDVLVLDIIARTTPSLRRIPEEVVVVPDGEAGIELLRRCRTGYYGDRYKDRERVKIFIRTARQERRIRSLCEAEGCDGFFAPGTDDFKLIEAIKNHIDPPQPEEPEEDANG